MRKLVSQFAFYLCVTGTVFALLLFAQPAVYAQEPQPLSLAADSQPSSQSGNQSPDQTSEQSSDQQGDQQTSNLPPGPALANQNPNDGPVTLFPHSETGRYWISGQANIIFQWHPRFPAAYSGPNSFRPASQSATSKVYTLFTGLELTNTTEVFLDVESAGGHGLSDALGLAGFVNLDVVRSPDLGGTPYLARLMVRQVIPLSHEQVASDRNPFALATSEPVRRIEIRAGKFSLVDFFDVNSGGSDSHLQFMNWTVDNNGAYDYAADTRGYTDAVMIEYYDHLWAMRFAEALMPTVANGRNLATDVANSRSENLEIQYGRGFLRKREGAIRLLGYVNHADMGNYRQAIENFQDGETSTPDIIATRHQGRKKYGFGLNASQDLTSKVGVFGRLGWNDGRNESFAYTEVDRTLELGTYFYGQSWHRPDDRAGAVFVMNGISGDHREYLALGGLGFLLGDGGLTYGPEKIFEGYYTAHVWRGIFAAFDLQHINNPGYNQARGPVIVPGLRLHVDL